MKGHAFLARHKRRASAAKSYDMEQIRRKHPAAYAVWTEGEEERLFELHDAGRTADEIARALGGQPGGIRSRLRKLNATDGS